MAAKMTETEKMIAEERAEELISQYEETRMARVEEQRERIRRKMPEVLAAINAYLDKCIQSDNRCFPLSKEELQRLRDL